MPGTQGFQLRQVAPVRRYVAKRSVIINLSIHVHASAQREYHNTVPSMISFFVSLFCSLTFREQFTALKNVTRTAADTFAAIRIQRSWRAFTAARSTS
jgi:hypothetical protein